MTLPLRRVVFWMHLVAGVSAGLVVLVMSVTGVLLAYEKQIVRWADGVAAPPALPGQARLPLDQVVEHARAARPDAVAAAVTIRRDEKAPVEVSFGRTGSVFVNAYTGEVLGSGSPGTRAFFRSVMEWHRWLARTDASRPVGKAITGISNLLFLFIVISGFYLWWPRAWTSSQFRQVLLFRGGLSSKARDFNWHHVIGFWSLVPLAIIVWSGVVIGYPWASDLTFRMAGEAPPPRAAGPGGAGGAGGPGPGGPGRPDRNRPSQGERTGRPDGSGERGPGAKAPARVDATRAPAPAPAAVQAPALEGRPYRSLAALMDQAAAHSANWRILIARLPAPRDQTLQVTVDTGTGAQPQKKGTLHLDRLSGTKSQWEPFESQSAGRQWRSWMRFVHTGEYYGLAGQTVAMLATAGSVVLVWTGLALTWRRFRAWRARSAPRAARTAA